MYYGTKLTAITEVFSLLTKYMWKLASNGVNGQFKLPSISCICCICAYIWQGKVVSRPERSGRDIKIKFVKTFSNLANYINSIY